MKKSLTIALVVLTLALVNCKDNGTTDDPEPAKTLNKSLLTNKYWTNSVFSHYFRSDGNYCDKNGTTVLGTWKWVSNSDSLEIDYSGSTDDELWQIQYVTETEMSARLAGGGNYLIFTKQ